MMKDGQKLQQSGRDRWEGEVKEDQGQCGQMNFKKLIKSGQRKLKTEKDVIGWRSLYPEEVLYTKNII